MPSDEEIMVATVACFRDEGVDPIRALIRTAVERALAEQREAIALDVDLAKMCAERLAEELRVLRLIIQSDKVQRRREVIEARICGIQAVAEIIPTGLHSYSIAKRWIAALRAELAALDKEGSCKTES